MNPVFEDMFLGPLASPSFSEGLRFRWEDSRRRVRVVFAGITVADSMRVMLLHECGLLPVFYFPLQDVLMDLLAPTEHPSFSPLTGAASYWTIQSADRAARRLSLQGPGIVLARADRRSGVQGNRVELPRPAARLFADQQPALLFQRADGCDLRGRRTASGAQHSMVRRARRHRRFS